MKNYLNDNAQIIKYCSHITLHKQDTVKVKMTQTNRGVAFCEGYQCSSHYSFTFQDNYEMDR